MNRSGIPDPVLVLAGLDPSGGAGLTLDVAVLQKLGLHPLPVATCLTVQSRKGFAGMEPVESGLLETMITAACEQAAPRAVKIGLLAGPEQAELLARVIPDRVPVILDPVLKPTLARQETKGLSRALVRALIPRGVIVTPNLPELESLSGGAKAPEEAAGRLLEMGAAAVVVTGGHGVTSGSIVNRLHERGGGMSEFTVERVCNGEVHGTGCAFTSLMAGHLARGESLSRAVRLAGEGVARMVGGSWSAGPGPGVLGFH